MDPTYGFVGLILFLLSFTSLMTVSSGQWYKPWCFFRECCNDDWVTRDLESLRSSLSDNLFGQHLVHSVVYGSLKGHASYQPEKPLVLSFHGSTGTGKNYVSQWIAKSWFKMGMDSSYVHVFSGTRHFPYESDVARYKRELQNVIRGKTWGCKHQIFIFDEIDSFPSGLLNSISSYLDYHEKIAGVDHRSSIFIFLSNAGDTVLQEYTSDFYVRGLRREDIRLGEMEKALVPRVFSAEDTGLGKSRLIDSHLVSHYVPFLPLERHHVRRCVEREMEKFGDLDAAQREEMIDEVLAELQFTGPSKNFSVKGCKNVAEKTNFVYIHRQNSNQAKTEL